MQSKALLIIIATLVGIALVAIVMYLFRLLAKMQASGNIDVNTMAVGCTGRVYLTIPGERKGEGKVQITIGGAVREYNAVTESETPLKTGTPIRVVDALIQADKRFELVVLPGQRHGFGPMNEYFFWKMADWYSRWLMGDRKNRPVDIPELNND